MDKNNLILLAITRESEALSMKKKLISNGYDVILTTSKKAIFELLIIHKIDLLIADLEIEDADAITVCQEIRKTENIYQPYVIVIGERPEDYVQTIVFDSGADDYILKPLNHFIVMARIKALISRKIKVSNPKIVDIKTNLLINIEEHLVYLDSKKIELPRKEFEILNLLYSNPKKIFTRIEITNLVWGNDSEDKDHNIDVFISKIRKELGGEVIKTIKGVGYTLTAA
jgi:two-component system alkaline phosphatase synthesis response regulator PhoP